MYKYLLLLSTLFGYSVMLSCSSADKTETSSTSGSAKFDDHQLLVLSDAQLKNMELKTEKPKYSALSEFIRLKGKIDVPPQNLVSISAPLGGYLKSSHLLPGMHIRKGEKLAVLEDKLFVEMQEAYLKENIKLSLLRMDSSRQRSLYAQKAASEKTMQEASSACQEQWVMVNALKEKLKLINIRAEDLRPETISRSITIYSPIDGFVSKVFVNVGKYVQDSDVLFELVNPEDIHLNLTVYEKDIERLHIGQTVWAYTNNDTASKYRTEIILIGKDVSPERFVEVHCHFESYKHHLLPGMYMNAEVMLAGATGLVVPNSAIQGFEGKDYLFVQEANNKFKLHEVKRLNNNGTSSRVVSPDLDSNMNIVTQGAYTLLMAMKNTEAE